jgi:hypothetical protein
MAWLSEHWHLIVGGIAALAGGGVWAWPYLPSMPGKAKSDKPDYRRGLDALDALSDELRKAGNPESHVKEFQADVIAALLGVAK